MASLWPQGDAARVGRDLPRGDAGQRIRQTIQLLPKKTLSCARQTAGRRAGAEAGALV
jgi:hypothetical protein